MAGYAADTAAATRSGTGQIDMAVIGFSAPELVACFVRIVVKEGEIQITMENVATRQG